MPRTPHLSQKKHRDAEAFIAYLMGEKGTTTESNADIAAALGISKYRLEEARRHSVTCTLLGGYTIAYRRRKGALVLMDPMVSASTVLEALRGDRTVPMFAGWRSLRDAYRSMLARMVAIIETVATEALNNGDRDLNEALGYAATDIAAYGEVQPATMALLAKAGAI